MINKADLTNNNRFDRVLNKLSKLDIAKFEFSLKLLLFLNTIIVEFVWTKDYTYNITTGKLENTYY